MLRKTTKINSKESVRASDIAAAASRLRTIGAKIDCAISNKVAHLRPTTPQSLGPFGQGQNACRPQAKSPKATPSLLVVSSKSLAIFTAAPGGCQYRSGKGSSHASPKRLQLFTWIRKLFWLLLLP